MVLQRLSWRAHFGNYDDDDAQLGGSRSKYIQIVEMVPWLSMIAFINVM